MAATLTDTFTYTRIERGPLLVDHYSQSGWSQLGGWYFEWYYYAENQYLGEETYSYELTWNPQSQRVVQITDIVQSYEDVLVYGGWSDIYDLDIHEFVYTTYEEYDTFLFETEEIYYEVQAIPEPLTLFGASTAIAWGALMRRRLRKE